MKNKKATLYTIIVLLIIFLPLAVIATSVHFKNAAPKEENPNHEFKVNGKLYFYKENELLGTYTCEHPEEYCDYAIPKNKKEETLLEHETEANTKLSIVDDRFVFLIDATTSNLLNANIILYDIVNNRKIGEYKEVKNYGIGIENNNFIVKNENDLWGVIAFFDGVNLKIPFNYDYIGLVDRIDNASGKINADIFAIKKENTWKLFDANNHELTNTTRDIIAYNEENIITKEENGMHLMNFQGENIFQESYPYINFYNKYIEIIDNDNNYYLYDVQKQEQASQKYEVGTHEDVELKTNNGNIEIYIKNELIETIAIN